MRLELGCSIQCSDGVAEELADVVIDPRRRCVTHLVVAPHRRHRLARLVPIEFADDGEGTDSVIVLRCTTEELHRLPTVEEFAYLRIADSPLTDRDWDVGIQTVLAAPSSYGAARFGELSFDLDPHVGLVYDRVPKGEVEIRRASEVISADGHRLGHVDGLVLDRDGAITHIIFERGHLFGRREVTAPIGAIARIATDSVTVGLTNDELGSLPAARVHRWIVPLTARAGGTHARPRVS